MKVTIGSRFKPLLSIIKHAERLGFDAETRTGTSETSEYRFQKNGIASSWMKSREAAFWLFGYERGQSESR